MWRAMLSSTGVAAVASIGGHCGWVGDFVASRCKILIRCTGVPASVDQYLQFIDDGITNSTLLAFASVSPFNALI